MGVCVLRSPFKRWGIPFHDVSSIHLARMNVIAIALAIFALNMRLEPLCSRAKSEEPGSMLSPYKSCSLYLQDYY